MGCVCVCVGGGGSLVLRRPMWVKLEISACLQTRRPGSLIFGVKLQLEGIHQDCSNYGPGVKMAPFRRSFVLHRRKT